jgi:hypothetical protein
MRFSTVAFRTSGAAVAAAWRSAPVDVLLNWSAQGGINRVVHICHTTLLLAQNQAIFVPCQKCFIAKHLAAVGLKDVKNSDRCHIENKHHFALIIANIPMGYPRLTVVSCGTKSVKNPDVLVVGRNGQWQLFNPRRSSIHWS